jgi:hypothetical protein
LDIDFNLHVSDKLMVNTFKNLLAYF